MIFTSWHYFLFLLVTLLLFQRLHLQASGRMAVILLASYIFYGLWDVRFLALLFTSTIINYICGIGMGKHPPHSGMMWRLGLLPAAWLIGCRLLGMQGMDEALLAAIIFVPMLALLGHWLHNLAEARRRRGFFLLAIIANLILLGFFKYFGFFVASGQAFLQLFGLTPDPLTLNILLPVGISFYTFQTLSYIIDCYRGKTEAVQDFIHFASYVTFFPQLVAGPIERSNYLLPQLKAPQPMSPLLLHEAARMILVGYFQKVFVADNCAMLADYVFAPQTAMNAPWAIIGVLAFAFQIYGDFAGYSNIARGSALLFGVRLSQNFAFPYLARTPSEFWRRWHITLSMWIQDYIYIPLGGNKGSRWATLRNLMLAMFLAGLWHGAAWNFIFWGIYHGLLLVLYKLLKPLANLRDAAHHGWLVNVATWMLMSVLTLIGWGLFRSVDMASFWLWLQALFNWSNEGFPAAIGALRWLLAHTLPLIILQWLTRKSPDETHLEGQPVVLRGTLYLLLFLFIATSIRLEMEFIYFQF